MERMQHATRAKVVAMLRYGAIALLLALSDAQDLDRPQYVCLNKAFPGGWLITDPTSFTQASIDELLAAMGNARGTPARKLCVSFDAWTLYAYNETTALESVDALLALVTANDLPLSISLDPTQWWQGTSLYNWWDPSAPGFSPANVANVEWTAPSPANATQISWRNWGSQMRMPTPHPNLASPAFRAAAATSVAPLAARIGNWYAALPSGKKHLLAYVRATQELWVGTNYYFYPGGNALAPQPASRDPTGGPARAAQLGYAAVCGGGRGGPGCSAGDPLTVAQLDAVVQSFGAFAAGVLSDAGIPRSRVMLHTGVFWQGAGAPAGGPAFNSPAAALVGGAAPAWSMYGAATDPARDPGWAAAVGALDGAPWGAPEWLAAFTAGEPQAFWAAALAATLAARNNRLIVVQNFESVRGDAAALAALAAALAEPPACVVDAPTGLAATRINATAWALAWAPPRGAPPDALDVAASTLRDTLPSGALAVPDVYRARAPGAALGATLVLPQGFDGAVVWWAAVARGCGGAQTAAADAVAIEVSQKV